MMEVVVTAGPHHQQHNIRRYLECKLLMIALTASALFTGWHKGHPACKKILLDGK